MESCEICEHFYCILFADSSVILIFILLAIVILSAIADYGLEWVEEKVHHSRHMHHHLLEKVKTELLILGLLSFVLFFVNYHFTTAFSHTTHFAIEFLHMEIFIGMMFYIAFVVFIISMLDFRTRHWETWETSAEEQGLAASATLPAEVESMGMGSYFLSSLTRKCNAASTEARQQYNETRYKLIRAHFIKHHHLKSKGNKFKFYLYLQACLENELMSLVSISLKIWVYILAPLVLALVCEVIAGHNEAWITWYEAYVVFSAEHHTTTSEEETWQRGACWAFFVISVLLALAAASLRFCTFRLCHKLVRQHGSPELDFKSDADYTRHLEMDSVSIEMGSKSTEAALREPLQRKETAVDEETGLLKEKTSCIKSMLPMCFEHAHPYIHEFPFRAPDFIRNLCKAALLYQALYIGFFFLVILPNNIQHGSNKVRKQIIENHTFSSTVQNGHSVIKN